MNSYEKRQIVAEVNFRNKTCFRYDYKTDTVIEDFNKESRPMPFDVWYKQFA